MMGLRACFSVEAYRNSAGVAFSYDVGLETMATLISAEMHFKSASDTAPPNIIRRQITALGNGFILEFDGGKECENLMAVMEKVTEVSERIGRIRYDDREGRNKLHPFYNIIEKICNFCGAPDDPDTWDLLES
ncbi:MAG: hypothetical protein L6R37_007014, partial [Teloschistes peruensis]